MEINKMIDSYNYMDPDEVFKKKEEARARLNGFIPSKYIIRKDLIDICNSLIDSLNIAPTVYFNHKTICLEFYGTKFISMNISEYGIYLYLDDEQVSFKGEYKELEDGTIKIKQKLRKI